MWKDGVQQMAQQAIGMIETRGLVPLVQAADAALKAAHVRLTGWRKVGSGLCTVFVTGDVAAVTGRGGRRWRGRPYGRRGREDSRHPAPARRVDAAPAVTRPDRTATREDLRPRK